MRVASRNHQHVLLRRPLQLLYPLEFHEDGTPETDSEDARASIPDVCISAPVEEHDCPALNIRNQRDTPCLLQPRELMRNWGLGLKSYRTNLMERSITGTVNLRKDSNNLSILIFIAYYLGWPCLVGGCWNRADHLHDVIVNFGVTWPDACWAIVICRSFWSASYESSISDWVSSCITETVGTDSRLYKLGLCMSKYADGHIRNQIQGLSLSSQLQYVFYQECLCAQRFLTVSLY